MQYVLVLGNDFNYEAGTIGRGTKKRCRAALDYARTHQCCLVFAAGRSPRMKDCSTMADEMAKYVRACKYKGPIVANTVDDDVWSTLREIEWTFNKLGDVGRELHVVTNSVHFARAKLIAWG